MRGLTFDNRFVRALPADPSRDNRPRQVEGAAYSFVDPTPVVAPRLLSHSPEVACDLLGLDPAEIARPDFAEVFGGNRVLPGMQPVAACYGGHQFGHWAGQLGDGRAISLGEVLARDGSHQELQLKGAGPTPYSRRADGRAVLRSSIREFLCSEAMHHLGVPTTRALSLVATGDDVVRDMFYDGNAKPEPGAVVCRVAPSFLRFGNYELPASRGDRALLERLVDFTIEHFFADLEGDRDRRRAEWFTEICRRTAVLMAHWMRVGFVHGVMNTDNLSILGLTIDYGPYGWIDNFDTHWTPNTTDAQTRRYRFGQQPAVAHWNLRALALALEDLIPGEDLESALQLYVTTFQATHREFTAAKLGLESAADLDDALVQDLWSLLQRGEVDMTLFFRALASVDPASPDLEALRVTFYAEDKFSAERDALAGWLDRYAASLGRADSASRVTLMNRTNPRFVLRNYLAQEAIDEAEAGRPSRIDELLAAARRPYDDVDESGRFCQKRPDWARVKAGCSMLSCSS
jgi:uncharacterized protein YdiU (UPF0061 family)